MIRPEQQSDVDSIRRVHEAAFPTNLEARLVDELRAAGNLTISLVAEVEGEVVGHIALSPVTVDGLEVGLGLGPVAVLPDCQRSGIGAALVSKALDACRNGRIPLVVVLGNPTYYSRFGFLPANRHHLQNTYGGGDSFQAMLLDPHQRPPSGVVHYAPEFALFG